MSSATPQDEEYRIEDNAAMITQTDTKGVITYANRRFRQVSGYSLEELVGKPHSIVRHPDMPSGAFVKMWESIASGQSYNLTIKNRRKDGRYYWVELAILPIKDAQGNIEAYMSVARAAQRQDIAEVERLYTRMHQSAAK